MDFLKFFGKNKKQSNEEEQNNATIVITPFSLKNGTLNSKKNIIR